MTNDDCKINAVIEREKSRSCHRSSWTTLLAGSLIVQAGWAAYSNSFHGPFIHDDIASIPDNLTIRNLGQLGIVFSPPCGGETVGGRPILNLSFSINYALGGTEVWGYHVTNLAIHLINGLLLLGILRRTFLLPSLRSRFGHAALPLSSAIALLWIVHPLATEAVTYTVQRAESLASLFYLLVMYAVIRGARSQRATVWYIGAVVACWLGIATKEIVVTAPVMTLLYDRTLLSGTFRQAWRQRWKLYLGLATSWALLLGLILQRGFVTKAVGSGIWIYARSQPGVILYYLRQVLWPHPLCVNWWWSMDESISAIGLPMLGVGLLLGVTIWGLVRGRLGLLGAWFFLILAPSSSIVPLMQSACEHRMYLPLAAVITLLVIGVYLAGQKWIVRGRLAAGLSLVILAAGVLGVLTFQRNQEYRSESVLWEDAARTVPHNPAALNNWGNILLDARQPEQAIEYFQEALRLKPSHAEAHNNWGNALMSLGRPLEAIEHFKQAVRWKPDYADAHYNWGGALSSLARFPEAIEQYQETLRLKPDHALAHNNWGNACLALGQPLEAIPHYEQALRIHPDYAEAHFNLAMALSRVGRLDEAIKHGREAARRMPDNPQIQKGMAELEALDKSLNTAP